MTIRVRERGPRRRCSTNRTLVRTIPALQQEPPPVPLSNGTSRHYQWAEVADYEGLATGSWSSSTISENPDDLLGLRRAQNVLYHHFVVANGQTDSYEAILPPIRFSPLAPASDGGVYDGWYKPNSSGSYQNVHRQWHPYSERIECAKAALPSDSHCEFPGGYTQINYNDPVKPTNNPSGTSFGSNTTATLDTIAATTQIAPGTIREVYRARIRVNGSPVGSLLTSLAALKAARITYAKGDVIEWDIWYRIRYNAVSTLNPAPRKGVIYLSTSYVTSAAPWRIVATFTNLNTVPLFDFASHTYEVTIAGHTGWTLKNGSDGPHKIENDGLWTRSAYSAPTVTNFGTGLRWMYGSSFATMLIRTDTEVPMIFFQPGSLIPSSIFGYTRGDFYFYRPANGGSSGYRKSTTKKIVYTTSGGTNSNAETVNHAPSGVWDQAGTTTFDLIPWNNNLLTYIPGKGSGLSPGTTDNWIPTTITLTRVSL